MRGNALLRVPTINGTRYSAIPCITGTAKRNIITVPCMVNSWLYRSGPISAWSGKASCTRISTASNPAATKNPNAVTTKRRPSRL